MKRIIRQARSLGDVVADAVRRAVDPPLAADARPLDVKRAIVEAVEQQVEPAGAGRRVLPGDAVQVKVLAESAEQRKSLEAVLRDLGDAVKTRLAELQCQVPRRFAVNVSYVRRQPDDWTADQRLAVVVDGERSVSVAGRDLRSGLFHDPSAGPLRGSRPTGSGSQDGPVAAVPVLTIDVLRGEALKRHFTFRSVVVRIGRSPDPTDERGRPRTNDVAFLENENEDNRTVTRGHALIRFDARDREYRLFDEGSANGTRIVRSGEAIDLPRRDPVGVSLRSGDEVRFGKAAIRIRIDES
jgi:hypothetical protein